MEDAVRAIEAVILRSSPSLADTSFRIESRKRVFCFGASSVAAVFGSAPGSATPPEHRFQFNPYPSHDLSKQDISTLLGIGHFYFALTRAETGGGTRTQKGLTAIDGSYILAATYGSGRSRYLQKGAVNKIHG